MQETISPSSNKSLEVFQQLEEHHHEQVVHCYDPATGLKAIIAIHDTSLGPALGGTRMWHYESEAAALKDVLRLSRGMTYKAAISGLNIGGGKAVIIGDARQHKDEALMRRFGKFVNSLSGKYITAEDVGMTEQDMEYIRMETKHVTGLPIEHGGNGDPSPVTAYTTYLGIKASAKKAYGTDELSGKKVAIQGLGNVGQHLLKSLIEDGAEVMVADLYEEKVKNILKEFNVKAVPTATIAEEEVHIYAPCALGGTINSKSIPKLKCDIIAGAANNQLENEKEHGEQLLKKGIFYAPDFLINCGGLINVYSEYFGYSRESALKRADYVYEALLNIYDRSLENNIPTQQSAIEEATHRISKVGSLSIKY